jgi:5,6,7,8-tetrahydromethanopterin hydro-lyase
MSKNLMVGECLHGEGNEVAHIDLIIGPKDGPVGQAFVNALTSQRAGHTSLLSLVNVNLPAKPDTVMLNKVTIKGGDQAAQMFGPAQAAVARAVVDSVQEGVISQQQAEDWCVVAGVFIHWDAKDNKKIYDYNYAATKEAIRRAINGLPTVADVLQRSATERHAVAGGVED